jgi:hypothetical protein
MVQGVFVDLVELHAALSAIPCKRTPDRPIDGFCSWTPGASAAVGGTDLDTALNVLVK